MKRKPAPEPAPVDQLTPRQARIEHARLGENIAEHARRYYQ
jgi:DNA ligase (NAD+)